MFILECSSISWTHLGVFAPGEHERREAVAQRVERYVWQTGALEQRLEGAPEDIVAVEGSADRRGENEARLLPEPSVLESLFFLFAACGALVGLARETSVLNKVDRHSA